MVLKIQPWIGKNYQQARLFNRRLLVVGESNYMNPGSDKSDCESLILDNVRDCVFFSKVSFFTKVARLLLRAEGLPNDARTLIENCWHDIAFYNFVLNVFDGPRERPNQIMWEEGVEPFLSVVEKLMPQMILILGADLELYIPKIADDILVVAVHHPSGQFSYAPWVKKVREAVYV